MKAGSGGGEGEGALRTEGGGRDTVSGLITSGHRLGHSTQVASWWRQAGAGFEEAMAYADAGDLIRRARGMERLDLLGAVAVADRLRLLLRRDGLAQVPQRSHASTRANPQG